MKFIDQIMANTRVYRLWQTPFAVQKFAPILAHNDLARVRRVLDVGCGPGTNTAYFPRADYLGVDWNPKYIEYARRHFQRRFVVADITQCTASSDDRFDFILVNSFLHHVDAASATRVLSHLNTLLTEDGHIHILDLVLPPHVSIPRLLTRMDRGKFPRPLNEWLMMVEQTFEPAVIESYDTKALGVAFWNMIYFKGRGRK